MDVRVYTRHWETASTPLTGLSASEANSRRLYIQSMGLRQSFGHFRSSWDPCTMFEISLPKESKTIVPEGSAAYPEVPQGWR